jgi:ATP-dependent protease ClpP protease subunit
MMADHHIVFTGEIKATTANNFVATLVNLAVQQTDKVTVAINSAGGEVVHGIAMYNAMRAMPYPVITHNFGNVDSIANVVFLGGNERYACPASTFMFHGVGFNAAQMGNMRLEENGLKAMLDTVLADHKRISGVFADRTGGKTSVQQGMKLFREQRTRSAQWALDRGFATGISDFTFPVGGNVHLLIN